MPLLRHHRKFFWLGVVLATISLITIVVNLITGNQKDASSNLIFFLVNVTAAYFNWRNRSRYDKMVDDMNAERRQKLIQLTIGE